ncbi:MAG TPA: magnesium transporter CorA family protein [Candidatus Limnocylindrales bacterium]|nr:magnesium transporter CorA family protein [Candidatus Limnocylindrales bacterium]
MPAAGPAPAAAGAIRIVARRGSDVVETSDPADLRDLVGASGAKAWIDLVDPPGALLAEVSDTLGLHPLIVEDITERNQRAKFEEIEDDVHIVVFALEFPGEVVAHEIDIVATKGTLLTVHPPAVNLHGLQQLRLGAGAHLARGVDFLLYAILDGVVDGYFPVLDRLADDLDALQDDVVVSASSWSLQRLFGLKRELIALRRAVSPAREILNQLTNRDLPLIAPEHVVYFRDIYDHLIRVTDELDNYRELVAGTLEVYLTTVSNNLSAIMKRLTGVTVILAGVGAVAGIFGMSEAALAFQSGEGAGFWIVTAGIVALAAGTAIVLRRINWI